MSLRKAWEIPLTSSIQELVEATVREQQAPGRNEGGFGLVQDPCVGCERS